MTHPRSGDTVRVHYTGRLDDGRVFASSRAQGPLELTVGTGTLLPSVEETLTRMEPGEERTVTIPAERTSPSIWNWWRCAVRSRVIGTEERLAVRPAYIDVTGRSCSNSLVPRRGFPWRRGFTTGGEYSFQGCL